MVGDGSSHIGREHARNSNVNAADEATKQAAREEAERKAKAAEALAIQQKAADDTRTALQGLVPKLVEKPNLLGKIVTQFTDPSLLNGIKTIAQLIGRDVGKTDAISLYNALQAAKIELVPEQVIPYLLKNGLLEALSQVSKEQANAIFTKVLELPFIKDSGFTLEDRRNFAAAFDKTMDIVEVFKKDKQTLAQLGSIVAEIGFPREADPNESQKDKEIRVALANNRIYVALKTVLPSLAEQPAMISALVTQLATTVDFSSEKIKEIRDRQELIKDIDAALEQGVKLSFYLKQKAYKQEQEALSEEIKNRSQDDRELETKRKQLANLQKKLIKSAESTESKRLSPEERKELEDRKKLLEGLATPIDKPKLIIAETLGLKPGKLTILARFAEQPIKDLLAEKPVEGKTKLAEELVGIINLAETERAAKFMELAPRIVQNHSDSVIRFLGNSEVRGIIRENKFLQSQIAAQGFAGQEQKVVNLALDQVYPDLIGPALRGVSLVTLLEKTLNPEIPTAEKANAAIDFASTHREGIGRVIDAVASEDNVSLVQAALARAGVAEGEDLAKQVSGVIRDNKQAFLDLTEAVGAMKPDLRKLILEQAIPAKAPEEEGRVLETGASPTQDSFSEEEIVRREALIRVYRQLTGVSDAEIPDEFTTEVLKNQITLLMEAQKGKNEGTDSSRSESISSERDRGPSQEVDVQNVGVDSHVEDGGRPNSSDSLRIEPADVISPLHKTVVPSVEVFPQKKDAAVPEEASPPKPALVTFLDEYQSHIPKLLSSATPLVKALSKKNEATRSLVQDISDLMKAKEERGLLKASTNTSQEKKEKVEARERGLLSSVIAKGLQTARNPEVMEATRHAIAENRDLLAKIIDKKLVELAKGSKYEKYIKMINGKFVVKAMEHANNQKSLEALEAIEKFVSNPSISEGIYLAWKTNNIQLAIGAAAGYFKQKEEAKQQESPDKTVESRRQSLEGVVTGVSDGHHSRLPRVSSGRQSSMSRD